MCSCVVLEGDEADRRQNLHYEHTTVTTTTFALTGQIAKVTAMSGKIPQSGIFASFNFLSYTGFHSCHRTNSFQAVSAKWVSK